MDQIIVALEVVAPVFIIIALGYFLRSKKIIDEAFIKIAMKIVFNICLPGMLFLKVSQADTGMIFSKENFAFSSLVFLLTLVIFFCSRLLAKFVEEKSRGAFVQGSFRSNYIIIGYTILYSLLGDQIINRMALLVVVVVPLYNVLAIWVLSEKQDISLIDNFKIVSKKVVTNPLIIGIVLGMLVALFHIKVPSVMEDTVSKLGNVGTPLGLIGIGGYFTLENLKSAKASIISALLKVVIYPVLAILVSYFLGFNYIDTTIIFVIFGSPSAISSFIMATALDGDSQTAANIVIISTGLSLFTYIIGLFSLGILFSI